MKKSNEPTLKNITVFENDIETYKNMMFGLMLYQETAPKPIQVLQKISYKNMSKRGEKAIRRAKEILEDAKEGKKIQEEIETFEWPIILENMKFRIDIMLECYEELFPGRTREKALSQEEVVALRNQVMKRV